MPKQTDIPKLPDGWEKEDSIDIEILRQNGCLRGMKNPKQRPSAREVSETGRLSST